MRTEVQILLQHNRSVVNKFFFQQNVKSKPKTAKIF